MDDDRKWPICLFFSLPKIWINTRREGAHPVLVCLVCPCSHFNLVHRFHKSFKQIYLEGGSGKAMPGQQLCQAAYDGDAAKVSRLLSAQGEQSFINYQDARGSTPLTFAAQNGHAAVAKQLISARCNDLQMENWSTALQLAWFQGHAGIASLIRNRKQETPLLLADAWSSTDSSQSPSSTGAQARR